MTEKELMIIIAALAVVGVVMGITSGEWTLGAIAGGLLIGYLIVIEYRR